MHQFMEGQLGQGLLHKSANNHQAVYVNGPNRTEEKATAKIRVVCEALKSNTTLMKLDLCCEHQQPPRMEARICVTRGAGLNKQPRK